MMIDDVPLGEADKDQLEAYARKAFGVELNKRFAVEKLRAQVLDLIEKA